MSRTITLKNPDAKASRKQLWYVKKLTGKKYEEGSLTMAQADELIKQHAPQRNEKKSSRTVKRKTGKTTSRKSSPKPTTVTNTDAVSGFEARFGIKL